MTIKHMEQQAAARALVEAKEKLVDQSVFLGNDKMLETAQFEAVEAYRAYLDAKVVALGVEVAKARREYRL